MIMPSESSRKSKKSGSQLRDGVMKRGNTWSYVVRVKDPETGESKPKWVGGFETEDDAKAARDEARVKARRGEYVDRNTITVGEYLDDRIEDHAMEIKPGTLEDYRISMRLDLEGKQITVKSSTGVVDGEHIAGTTKSGRTHVVTLDEGTDNVLRTHQEAQEAEKLRVGDAWKGEENGHVFTTTWGGPTYPPTVTALPGKLIKAHNEPRNKNRVPAEPLPHARLHDLRRIHTTTPLLAGVPVHVIAARLGRTDPAITLRVYAHVIRSAETTAAGTFAQSLQFEQG